MNWPKKIVLFGLYNLLLIFTTLTAQTEKATMADAMRSNGKIYVVVGVILVILVGLFAYLIRLDIKIGKLEKKL